MASGSHTESGGGASIMTKMSLRSSSAQQIPASRLHQILLINFAFWFLFVTTSLWILATFSAPFNRISTIVIHEDRLIRQRTGARLAVVVPFAHSQSKNVIRNLETLWPSVRPCNPAKGYGSFIDLILYFHKDVTKHRGLVAQLKSSFTLNSGPSSLSNCFSTLRFMNAHLQAEEDAYPLGASRMFFRLFGSLTSSKESKAGVVLKRRPALILNGIYQYMYYMEPDNIPCKFDWLDRIYEEAVAPGDLWMRGSIIRNRNPLVGTWAFGDHLNGNAIYRLDDPRFVNFIHRAEGAFWREQESGPPPGRFLESYDIALWLLRKDRNWMSWEEFTDTAHLFQYTSTIQNWYRTRVNATKLCSKPENAETYFVHGREVVW
ncbi:hypothetical protein BJ742DRAFT_876174 [Cladochytrium replicatum]|nr:hypothetical protein BJ742DRAFT_876174 [Cladochytrium replicatum]